MRHAVRRLAGSGLVPLAAALLGGCATGGHRSAEPPGAERFGGPAASLLALAPTPPSAPSNDIQLVKRLPAADTLPDELARLADRTEQPDLWARLRAGFALPELDDPAVERFARHFAESRWLERIAPRAALYLYLLATEAEARGLPAELALLPIIESGLNPQALSPAKAAGLCQFIPETGRRFGLVQSHLVDKRRDLDCIGAMYGYLAENARRFDGDWFLALAAYNWGEGAVARARERNARRGLPEDYAGLKLPGETRAYVPQLLALRRLIEAPEHYGVVLPEIPNRPTVDCEVAIPADMDVALVERLAGVSAAEFRQLNAGVRRAVIPRATHPTICLPFEAAVHFEVRLAEHSGPLASLTTHTVASPTTILALAKRYRTTPEAIRAANDIPPGMRLKSGATVLVPRRQGEAQDIAPAVAMLAQLRYETEAPPLRRIAVRVARRDTLERLAARHGVTVAALQHWNPQLRSPLRAGTTLTVFIPRHISQGTPATRPSARKSPTRRMT